MPYDIKEMDGEFCVCGPDGKPVDGGCHPTKTEAEDHMQAMDANVGDARMSRVRPPFISEVALEAGQPRPIHMFRPGTFTDMNGRETSFTQDDVSTIVSRFSKRRKLPITERHDFGQAIGRLQDVWADRDGNLFGMPKWNAKGRSLLEDETYDGFSCELDKDDRGWVLIGGSLTNYPAVGGLEPVTLAAPPITEAPTMPELIIDGSTTRTVQMSTSYVGIRDDGTEVPLIPVIPPAPTALPPAREDRDNTLTQGVPPMSDIGLEQAPPAVLPPISDPNVQARLDAYLAQTQAQMAQREREIEQRLTADFERRMLETEQRNAIHAFARRATVTTPEQPYAIPGTAEELAQLLLETPSAARAKWSALLTRITTAGLVSFDEIGSSGDGGADTDRWSILVNAKVAAGMKRVEAIQAVAREHPDLYAAQQAPAKKGVR